MGSDENQEKSKFSQKQGFFEMALRVEIVLMNFDKMDAGSLDKKCRVKFERGGVDDDGRRTCG